MSQKRYDVKDIAVEEQYTDEDGMTFISIPNEDMVDACNELFPDVKPANQIITNLFETDFAKYKQQIASIMSQPEDILKYAELNAKNSLKQMLTILNSKFKDYLKENQKIQLNDFMNDEECLKEMGFTMQNEKKTIEIKEEIKQTIKPQKYIKKYMFEENLQKKVENLWISKIICSYLQYQWIQDLDGNQIKLPKRKNENGSINPDYIQKLKEIKVADIKTLSCSLRCQIKPFQDQQTIKDISSIKDFSYLTAIHINEQRKPSKKIEKIGKLFAKGGEGKTKWSHFLLPIYFKNNNVLMDKIIYNQVFTLDDESGHVDFSTKFETLFDLYEQFENRRLNLNINLSGFQQIEEELCPIFHIDGICFLQKVEIIDNKPKWTPDQQNLNKEKQNEKNLILQSNIKKSANKLISKLKK